MVANGQTAAPLAQRVTLVTVASVDWPLTSLAWTGRPLPCASIQSPLVHSPSRSPPQSLTQPPPTHFCSRPSPPQSIPPGPIRFAPLRPAHRLRLLAVARRRIPSLAAAAAAALLPQPAQCPRRRCPVPATSHLPQTQIQLPILTRWWRRIAAKGSSVATMAARLTSGRPQPLQPLAAAKKASPIQPPTPRSQPPPSFTATRSRAFSPSST